MRSLYTYSSIPFYKLQFSFSKFISLIDLVLTTPGLPTIEKISATYIKETNTLVYRIGFKHVSLSLLKGPFFTIVEEYRFECYVCNTTVYGFRGTIITALYNCKHCVVNLERSATYFYERNKERKRKRANKLR